jgi:sporulation protein YlmC with PRC-barrel domain
MRALRQCLIAVALLAVTPSAHAQTPGKVDLEAAEFAAKLIGAPVFARDGAQVGEVTDIAFDEDARPDRLRMTTGAVLGLGTRTLEVPRGAFITVRGAVVLEVPAEAVSAFAELAEPAEEK